MRVGLGIRVGMEEHRSKWRGDETSASFLVVSQFEVYSESWPLSKSVR
jgi:hypothetical protein